MDSVAILRPADGDKTPQAYNSIQYDAEKSLWHNVENRQLDAQFFHMGMGFRRRVRMFSVDPATHLAREIHFRPELFKYNDAGVDTKQLEGQSDLGFAGFRVFKAPELARRDVVSFLGASYFRAVDDTYQYGLSARGLAIDTYTDSKEEFPDFTAFWFDTVKPGATTFTVYALLDSASITGAYKFTIHCEKNQVIMDVENHLYARKDIKQLGIAPLTSMFSCSTNGHVGCAIQFVANSRALIVCPCGGGNGGGGFAVMGIHKNCSSMLANNNPKGVWLLTGSLTSPIIRTLWAGITNT